MAVSSSDVSDVHDVPDDESRRLGWFGRTVRWREITMRWGGAAIALVGSIITGCSSPATSAQTGSDAATSVPEATRAATARVTDVSVTPEGQETYQFTVTVESPDLGCDRYANWWEIVTPEGDLLKRRVLMHSHVDEQPFARSVGGVPVESGETVIVRSHMYPTGYSPLAMAGSIDEGFEPVTLPINFAAALSDVEPLPTNCAF